ncbi:MAG: tRNA (adenosine(37)-N6)-dimethylallyltransferase MiaA, partial [Candidatus Kapaibacterium sp.]
MFGPTASGKTQLSLRIAEELDVEIISADSRQVFRGLDIGTAKVPPEIRRGVPHHGIDICEPHESFDTGRFRRYAETVMTEIKERRKLPLIVGGTGLYLSALLKDFLDDEIGPGKDAVIKEHHSRIMSRRRAGEADALFTELEDVDPDSARKYHDRNPRRVDRALLYYHTHGLPFSEAHRTRSMKAHTDIAVFVIERDRDELNERIARRVNEMWDQGLEDEVRRLLDDGIPRHAQSLATVGYREMLEYLDGRLTRAQALEATVVATRRYAKRQRTWARHQFPDARVLRGDDDEMMR